MKEEREFGTKDGEWAARGTIGLCDDGNRRKEFARKIDDMDDVDEKKRSV